MRIDRRGGHNRKEFNVNFFKTWSPQMAYILGFIYADGAIEDLRKSSRTCYLVFSNNDKELLVKIRDCMSSKHRFQIRKPRLLTFKGGKTYLCAQSYVLKIGSKEVFSDLLKLGLTPRKSRRLKFPVVSDKYFNYFLRGYFDGDGCVHAQTSRKGQGWVLQVIFTCGCKQFLQHLSSGLKRKLQITEGSIYWSSGAYRLSYKKLSGSKILDFIYSDLHSAPYLTKKHETYTRYLQNGAGTLLGC